MPNSLVSARTSESDTELNAKDRSGPVRPLNEVRGAFGIRTKSAPLLANVAAAATRCAIVTPYRPSRNGVWARLGTAAAIKNGHGTDAPAVGSSPVGVGGFAGCGSKSNISVAKLAPLIPSP